MQLASPISASGLQFNRYLPFAFLYFFLNAAALPFGLTWMTLLSPLLYYWVVVTRKQEVLWPYLLVIFPFVFLHFMCNDVSVKSYLVSFFNLTSVYLFCQAVYTLLLKCNSLSRILFLLLKVNLFLCLVAIPFYFSDAYELFWIEQKLTGGVNDFRRLKMFTYEASHYATLFVPLFYYFFLGWLLKTQQIRLWFLIPALILPLIMSFSLGVLSVMFLSLILVFAVYFFRLMQKKRMLYLLFWSFVILVPAILLLLYLFPDNVFLYRLENVITGKDTSGKGRTFEAFTLAGIMLEQKSALWGIGLGQLKPVGAEIIRDFYLYPMDHADFAVPNVTAETLALFGWAGLVLRFAFQFFFFFYTRVWTNYFRMILFVFMFLYQFTGSYLTNHAEYLIWIFAFSPVFREFDIQRNEFRKAMTGTIQ